jgi:hypothetical protein
MFSGFLAPSALGNSIGRMMPFSTTERPKVVSDTLFGLLPFLFQLSYYSFAWYQTIIGDWGATIVMTLLKGELDAFLSLYKFQEQFNTLNVFLYQVLYDCTAFRRFHGEEFLERKKNLISEQSVVFRHVECLLCLNPFS